MTIIEKILARRSGKSVVSPGELAVVDVDTVVLTDRSFRPGSWRKVTRVENPNRVVVILDHGIPAPDRETAAAHQVARQFVRDFGIDRYHGLGRDGGISHVVVAEQGYACPGNILICSDSHTCSAGAFNVASRGVGAPDMIFALTTGQTWFRIAGTVRYDLTGRLKSGVSAKDLFLYIARTYGAHTNQNIEFGGSALAHITITARQTLCTMCAELGAEFATCEADSILLDYMHLRTRDSFEPAYPDHDANYLERRLLDLGLVEPMVALPDSVINNVAAVGAVTGTRIDQAFIGSCANGSLEDLEAAARILDGKTVAEGVRLIVTPASQRIYREALRLGYVATLTQAGAIVTNATCGACSGIHMGVLAPGEVCITSSTRNFKGRMGDATARIYLASTATVAASALAGSISGATAGLCS